MIILSNIKMGLHSLVASKQRSILALLGIIIGISAVIGLQSIGDISKIHSIKEFKEMGTDYVTISKGWSEKSTNSKDTIKNGITVEQVEKLTKRVRSIKSATPYGSDGSSYIFNGKEESSSVVAIKNDFFWINRLKIKLGRAITDFDQDLPMCVIGKDVAIKLQQIKSQDLIGAKLIMQNRQFTIVGILDNTLSTGMRPFDANQSIFIPLMYFLRIFEEGQITGILCRSNEKAKTEQITNDVKNYFKLVSPSLKIEVLTAEAQIQQMERQNQTWSVFLLSIGAIALIVGGIGVMNVMLASVTERRKEIGIRRALGALRSDIQMQFILEALILCAIGGTIGVILGVGISYFYAAHNQMEFFISIHSIILGVTVSTAVGVFFGYYPAYQASRLDPIIALRSE